MKAPKQQRLDILEDEKLWADQILQKTRGLIDFSVWENLAKCGREEWFKTCEGCHDVTRFAYRCSMKFCPLCNWMISRRRSEIIKHWSLRVKQPKHIVLTARNAAVLSRDYLRFVQKAFQRLRRQDIWEKVTGGCVSMEITNEGKGWHVHLHVLADVRWMPGNLLSIKWGELVGQDFAIVHVADAREHTYLNEVTKYVCKASQMAKWPAEEIAAFIGAVRGIRMFAPFGTLYKLQRELKREIENDKPESKPCECGSHIFAYESETQSYCRMPEIKGQTGAGAPVECRVTYDAQRAGPAHPLW